MSEKIFLLAVLLLAIFVCDLALHLAWLEVEETERNKEDLDVASPLSRPNKLPAQNASKPPQTSDQTDPLRDNQEIAPP